MRLAAARAASRAVQRAMDGEVQAIDQAKAVLEGQLRA